MRRRIGAAPLRALFELLAGPVAWPRTPGVMFGRYRTVAFDGCRSLKVPDSPRNRAWLGKLNASLGETGYPVIQLMTLVETGTRALIGAAFGTPADGETTWARKLLGRLDETMLVLMDRGFDAGEFLREVAATRAQFLVRLTSTRRPPVLRRFPDGSVLSVIGGVQVRIITASVTVTCHDGTSYGASYRLATTLLDCRAYPADALIRLYHERWEHEIAYLALRHTLLHGRVLRSQDPAGLQQEMRALLALYQALRIAITDAVATVPGTDPDRASYQIAAETAADLVTSASNIISGTPGLAGGIGRAVLANLHGPRRPRVCARKVKSPLSRWNKHPPGKPRKNLRVTKITATINRDHQQKKDRCGVARRPRAASTSHSASVDAAERPGRTSQLQSRTKIRQSRRRDTAASSSFVLALRSDGRNRCGRSSLDPGPRGGTKPAAARKASTIGRPRRSQAGHRGSPSCPLDKRFPHGWLICARRSPDARARRAAKIRRSGAMGRAIDPRSIDAP